MSSYTVANNLPNMMYELVAGGIISSLFIPTFMEIRQTRDEASAWRFTSHVFNLAMLGLGLLAIIGTVFPGPFIWTQTFRMSTAEASGVVEPATFFFRFFAIQVVLYGLGSVTTAVLNSQRRYLWPAIGPIFNNLIAIATMIAFVAFKGDSRIAYIVLGVGTTLAVAVMFGIQIPALRKSGWRHSWGLGFDDPALRKMLQLAVPTLVYTLTNLVAVSFMNASAFAVSPKGPSVLIYAWIFYQLPYGIFAVALATAIFTELAETAGKKDMAGFKDTFSRGLRATGVIMLPMSALLIALASPLVSMYRVGAFTAADVPLVASALRFWAIGLIFYATTMFLLKAFYSLRDTKTPMVINLTLTVIQIGLYTLLSTGIGGWKGIGINGIPIGDTIFFILMCTVLGVALRKRIGSFDFAGIASTFLRMGAASAIAGLVAWGITIPLASLAGGVPGALLQIAVGGAAGITVALTLGHWFGVKEVSVATDLFRRAGSRLRKS